MSYYYSYYIGYRSNGKIYPLGPFDDKHRLCSVVSRSRSYASELYRLFYAVGEDEASDELNALFKNADWTGAARLDVKYLPFDKLPAGDPVRKGYFLISDVKAYESDPADFDGFYDMLTPEVYAAKLQHELTFGKNGPSKDPEGYEYTEPNASDYMYYAYLDHNSLEYEVFLIRQAVDMFDIYALPDDAEVVILEREG